MLFYVERTPETSQSLKMSTSREAGGLATRILAGLRRSVKAAALQAEIADLEADLADVDRAAQVIGMVNGLKLPETFPA